MYRRATEGHRESSKGPTGRGAGATDGHREGSRRGHRKGCPGLLALVTAQMKWCSDFKKVSTPSCGGSLHLQKPPGSVLGRHA